MTRIRSIGWLVMMLLSLLVVFVASRYLALDPSTYFPDQRAVYVSRESVLLAHVGAAMLALLVGPWQFVGRIRRRSVRTHRVLGTIYVSACFVGGFAGVALSTTALGGWVSSLGFAALGSLWILTTALALRAILSDRVDVHRRWMIRSFSLCFAAVTLRLYLGIFGGLQAAGLTGAVTFTAAYTAVAWLCWVPNLAIGWRISLRPPSAKAVAAEATS